MTLLESGGIVNGSGTITNTPTGTRALTITGTFNGTTLGATMTSGTVQPINLQATVYSNQMTSTLQGSGFTGEGCSLFRQQP